MLRVRAGLISHASYGSEKYDTSLTAEDEAAVKIQAYWRGNKDREDCDARRVRSKPWGFYTHTLGLTYASSSHKSGEDAISSKRWLYLLLEEPTSCQSAQVVSMGVVGTILISIVGFVLETVPELNRGSPSTWLAIEALCTLVFTVEYICRITVCDEGGYTYVDFLTQPMNIFDLMAILPLYFEVIFRSVGLYDLPALNIFRVVRLVRVVRMFKLGRYAFGMRLIGKALMNSVHAISVLVFLLLLGVTVFSSAIFTIERLYCPAREEMTADQVAVYLLECENSFNKGVSPSHGLCCSSDGTPLDFDSIVAAFWWSTVTMTTVGYGEVYPKTVLGKAVAVVAMLVGMVLIALPVAIVGQKFQDVYQSNVFEEAKFQAGARMKVTGEVWSLVPASDVCRRLRQLKVKNEDLAGTVRDLVSALEEVWEQREQLSRGRRSESDKHDLIRDQMKHLLDGMESFIDDSPAPA
mmetsp:Transcript_11062/g.29261  ORF Transcript_11062/g.29261 Transcript_11062/m.29261 type:complete len:466 (-) Transcript_11062:113-1510(-)